MKKTVLSLLLLACFSANAQEKNIFDIARKGSIEEIGFEYKKNTESINTIDKNSFSPLILACYHNNFQVAKFLIYNVKDLNYTSEMGTALMAAAYKSQLDLVQLLLDKNANINLTDANGMTALMLAVEVQNPALIALLLKYKADKTLKNKDGKTAFELAILTRNESIINTLK
jgi:uncharacterized protein